MSLNNQFLDNHINKTCFYHKSLKNCFYNKSLKRDHAQLLNTNIY